MVKYLGVIGLILMIVKYAEPIEWVKVYFGVSNDTKLKDSDYLKKIIRTLVNCALCTGFWTGLAFYQDLYMATIIAFSSEIIYRIIDKLFSII